MTNTRDYGKKRKNYDDGGPVINPVTGRTMDDLAVGYASGRAPYDPITGRTPGGLIESLDKSRPNYDPVTGRDPRADFYNPPPPVGVPVQPQHAPQSSGGRGKRGSVRRMAHDYPGWPTMSIDPAWED